jgi:hypothetical protein
VKKPYGIIYVLVVDSDDVLRKKYYDLRELAKQLQRAGTPFSVKWTDNPRPKKLRDKPVPEPDEVNPYNDCPDDELKKALIIDRENLWEEKSNTKLNNIMQKFDPASKNYFTNCVKELEKVK